MTGDNRFVFVAPVFNAEKTVQQMLWSIAGQTYDNWKVVLIDDCSSDSTCQAVDNFQHMCASSNYHRYVSDDQIELIVNSEKGWEVANVLKGLQSCEDDDIVCRIDGDDWLTDLDALVMINSAYEQTGCDVLWTAHRWAFSDKNISGPMPKDADPYEHPWVSSHLKTFRKRLINGVNDTNFRGEDGEYIRRAGDQAIFLPVLQRASKRVFLPRVCYHYSIKDEPATYQTADAHFQRDEALFLRRRGYVE